MPKTIAIGIQNFAELQEKKCFYIDKTAFIREWWNNQDSVTLIARPRRFGKTLNMSMLECFFSNRYENRGDLFDSYSIWQDEEFRQLQGTYPVISLSFASVKEDNYETTRYKLCQLLVDLYSQNTFLLESDRLTPQDKDYFRRIRVDMNDADASMTLYYLSKFLYQYFGKRVILLLDEYDTPMQEAYTRGYWDQLSGFTRSLFNASFTSNQWLERGMLTGITRVSKESIFSDLNNLEVVTTTSEKYAEAFGFTQQEVDHALQERNLPHMKEVKKWYDGFTFGRKADIYNPWSILNYLESGKFTAYWANTSRNELVSSLLWKGSPDLKVDFMELLKGNSIHKTIDEQVVYSQLEQNENSIWSLLVASGYLKMSNSRIYGLTECDLSLTNYEVQLMFQSLVKEWFGREQYSYNAFVKALLCDDVKAMNAYMNQVALSTISYMDTGNTPSFKEPERFYHGLVLGLLVELRDRYVVTSNRESGFGRYDVLLAPQNQGERGIILEFKVFDEEEEADLHDTVEHALLQIEDKKYAQTLMDQGVAEEDIYIYGFAFMGKRVLIGS